MKEIERPLKEPDSIKLFAINNFLVDNYNRKKVLEWDGALIDYKAEDLGEIKHISKITAPSVLWLKTGVPVILLRNLSNELVNGLKGTVVGFEPVIKFQGLMTSKVKKTLFSSMAIAPAEALLMSSHVFSCINRKLICGYLLLLGADGINSYQHCMFYTKLTILYCIVE